MWGIAIIIIVTALVGLACYLFELRWRKRHNSAEATAEKTGTPGEEQNGEMEKRGNALAGAPEQDKKEESEECCGLHLVCEKDSLSPMSADILYYDDEELDRFAERDPASYTPEEEAEIREVFETLRPDEVLGWARSITQRHINLPDDVRDSLLMMARELRK